MSKVWAANSGMEVDDVWDDSELIKMYDQSIQEVYNHTSGITEKKYTGDDGKIYTWKVGGKCMAPFEENGETSYYAATIDSIGGKDDLEVHVTFIYYGNQAVVHMKELWVNEKAISEAVKSEKMDKHQKTSLETAASTSQKNASSALHQNSSVPLPKFAPPVPPNIIGMAPADQKEAMNSMLMSWYMSGYHTGYYQALADKAENANN